MAKVLIIGASHGIGLETVRSALRAGHNVRAFARSATGIPIQDANLLPLKADIHQRGLHVRQVPTTDVGR